MSNYLVRLARPTTKPPRWDFKMTISGVDSAEVAIEKVYFDWCMGSPVPAPPPLADCRTSAECVPTPEGEHSGQVIDQGTLARARRNTLDQSAKAAVQAAINAGDYSSNSVLYSPFQVLPYAAAPLFNQLWTTNDGFPNSFFQFNGNSVGDPTNGKFLPLGDIIVAGCNPTVNQSVLLAAPSAGDLTALASPVDVAFVLDSYGQSGGFKIRYYRLVPPAGYVSLGYVWGTQSGNDNPTPPNPQNYWCVRADLVQQVQTTQAWTDYHQSWDSNGTLLAPAFASDWNASGTNISILPTTFLSEQGGDPAYAIVGANAYLPNIAAIPRPTPEYDPPTYSGDTTTRGLIANVAIVPYTAVGGDTLVNQGVQSPFYFVASMPYWQCDRSQSTPGGGKLTITTTVGTSSSESVQFTKSTSMTVNCNVGAEFSGLSAGAGVSLTDTLEIQTQASGGNSTETTVTWEVPILPAPITWTWSSRTDIGIFRTDGSELSHIVYSGSDVRIVSAPAVSALAETLTQ